MDEIAKGKLLEELIFIKQPSLDNSFGIAFEKQLLILTIILL